MADCGCDSQLKNTEHGRGGKIQKAFLIQFLVITIQLIL